MSKNNGRLIAIGDLHGEITKLNRLLNQLDLYPEDHLVFLGDYIDRGENSKAVLERLFVLQEQCKCTFLKGNHEDMMVNAYRFGSQQMADLWLMNGGKKTLQDFGTDIPDEYLQWAAALPTLYSTPEAHFVHAGLDIERPAAQCPEASRLWSRYMVLTDYAWDRLVVCGHTIQHNGPLIKPNLVCLDTGSFLPGHPQTAMVFPGQQIYSAYEDSYYGL